MLFGRRDGLDVKEEMDVKGRDVCYLIEEMDVERGMDVAWWSRMDVKRGMDVKGGDVCHLVEGMDVIWWKR